LVTGLPATAEAKQNAQNGLTDKMNKTIDQYKRPSRFIPIGKTLFLAFALTVFSGEQLALAASVKGLPIKSLIKNLRPKKYRLELSGDASNQKIWIRSRGMNGLQLYLFNLEGQLIWQRKVELSGKECALAVECGDYFYELFANDERIDKGRLAIK
jgi:hypothetical protein